MDVYVISQLLETVHATFAAIDPLTVNLHVLKPPPRLCCPDMRKRESRIRRGRLHAHVAGCMHGFGTWANFTFPVSFCAVCFSDSPSRFRPCVGVLCGRPESLHPIACKEGAAACVTYRAWS